MKEFLLNNNQNPDEVAMLGINPTNHLLGDKIVISYPAVKNKKIKWGAFERCCKGKFTKGLFNEDWFQDQFIGKTIAENDAFTGIEVLKPGKASFMQFL